MNKNKPWLALLLVSAATPAWGSAITDITVFGANSEGNDFNSIIWNTQGGDTDLPAPGRFNLYVTPDPLSELTPTFINGYNDVRTRVSINLAPGTHTFSIYGNGVNRTFDPAQYFALNLYFDGNQSAPGITGLTNLANTTLTTASHPNGLGIFQGAAHQGAGTLSAAVGNYLVTLVAFSWITDGNRDIVWPYHANDAPYSSGDGHLDYYGSFTIRVAVPSPAPFALLLAGLAGLGIARRRT